MCVRIETKKGFVDHFIDCNIDPASFLAKIESLVDWTSFDKYLKKNVKRGPAAAGQPAYPDLVMFKVLLLQYWYRLSDSEASKALRDRISFTHFIGLPFDSSKPDGSTICRFRNRLLEKGHYRHLLELFNKQLEKNGLMDIEAESAEKGYQDRIMKKAYRNKPLSEEDKKRNKAIGKIRWVVERSFGTLKKVQEFVRARYLGLCKVDMEFNFRALVHNMKKTINLSA